MPINQLFPKGESQSSALEVATLRAELAKAKSDLDEFIYLASHDLKSPLNAIDNLADWLVEDIGSQLNEESQNHLMMIKGRAQRAKMFINDLLQYSRVGKETEVYESIDFNKTVTFCAAQANANNFQLVVKGCDVRLPKQSLMSVLFQLISNAVKHHTTNKGKINITCQKLSHAYQIEVTDDGPGISPQHHQKAFKKFQTLKSRDDVEGSGMGLALVEKTLSLYDAKVTLSSDGKSGSTFIIEWPFESKLKSVE